MNFDLNTEQSQLQQSLRRLLEKDYRFDWRTARIKSETPIASDRWQALAELGVMGIGIPEACGGLGTETNVGGDGSFAEDTMLAMHELGRSLVVEPYWSSVVVCGALLRECAPSAPRDELLAAIVDGSRVLSLAAFERAGRFDAHYVETTAVADSAGFRLNGAKTVVLHAEAADVYLVSARTSGAAGDRGGISLFAVPRGTPGVVLHSYATYDGQRAAELRLSEVQLPANAQIDQLGTALPAIERAVEFGTVALCAEAVGAMEVLGQQTLEYLKTRKQFGVPIGTFQALQHRMVDMFIATEQARSITLLATMKLADADAEVRSQTVRAAKTLVGQSARSVGQQAVQLHGGMGVTDELPVSHYFKRLTAIDLTFGDQHAQRARFADAAGFR